MGDPYDGPDRRENNVGRRADNGHCEAHVWNMERIAKLEAREDNQDEKFEVVFQKLDEQAEIMRCVKSGQDVILAKFAMFERGYNERVALSNEVIGEYRQAMISINARFNDIGKVLTDHLAEYRKFDWFRKPLQGTYEKAPGFIFKWTAILLGFTVAAFIVLHQLDLPRIAKWFGVGK